MKQHGFFGHKVCAKPYSKNSLNLKISIEKKIHPTFITKHTVKLPTLRHLPDQDTGSDGIAVWWRATSTDNTVRGPGWRNKNKCLIAPHAIVGGGVVCVQEEAPAATGRHANAVGHTIGNYLQRGVIEKRDGFMVSTGVKVLWWPGLVFEGVQDKLVQFFFEKIVKKNQNSW